MVEATKLSGRYVLEERIARGGMGTVYGATDERLGRRVAVKLLKGDLAEDTLFVERFRREARSVATLIHPNIANVFDYGEDHGHSYIVMELVEGRDLARVLAEAGPLDPARAITIATQVCEALGHAHASGVVHRDVKPANVIVGPGDRVKVTDFGIAQAAGDATLTAAGSVLGTAQYISPEQASDGDVGPPSDIYSMGIVLYEMVTGSAPFTGDSAIALAMRHVSETVPPPSSARPGVPQVVDHVVGRATAKEPGARYRNGAEMAAALEGSEAPTASTAVLAPAPATESLAEAAGPGTDEMAVAPQPPARPRGAPLGRAIAIAFLLLGLLAAAVAAMTFLGDDETRRPERTQPGAAAPEDPVTASETPEPAPEQVTVPDGLVGSNFADASAVLTENGLRSAREDVESDEAADTVVSADPAEGAEVSPGDVVTLFVSSGPPSEEPPPGDEVPPEDDGEDEDPGDGDPPGEDKGRGKGKAKDKAEPKDKGKGRKD